MNISIIGTGSWGTANAFLLASEGHAVTVWGRDANFVEQVHRTRENSKSLPGVELPAGIRWTSDRATAMKDADVVVVAVPSRYFEDICRTFVPYLPQDVTIVSLTKGFCPRTYRRMTEIAAETFGTTHVAALSGPSHAEEVVKGMPTAVTVAAAEPSRARLIQTVWSGPRFRVYTSADPVGVEIGGAVKNVLAIAVGCSDGMGFGDNTRAALITRGLVEMKRFVLAYGGQEETLNGLAGIGDLIVTCTSVHSRNHSVGERLGKGEKIEDVLGSMQMVAEGVWNSKVVHEIAKKLGVDMPICEMVYALCYKGLSAKDAAKKVMERPLTSE